MRRLLEAEPDVMIEGEADTIEQARELIHAHQPDAIFLDIVLTQGTGFELLEGLDHTPGVVFVTAHTDYRSEEHTSELQSLMRIAYAALCLKKQTQLVYRFAHIHTAVHDLSVAVIRHTKPSESKQT